MSRNIIIFSANYLPNLGGVERYTYNLAKKMTALGYNVNIVTSNTNNLAECEKLEGIQIYRLPCYNLLAGRFPVSRFNKKYKALYKEIKAKKYDICIVNTRFYLNSLVGVRFGAKNSTKTICIEHGTNHFTINNKFWDRLGHLYEHFITFWVKRNCRDFYGVSLACNEWLLHFNINAKGTLYNAIDIDHINQLLNSCNIDKRKELEIPSDALLICYTGRLVKEKGILKLLNAVKELNNKNSNVYLAIAGDGDLAEIVESAKTNNILFLRKLDFENVIALLKVTDIFCLPTDYPEGFPTSVLEAAACRCFIISTTSGGSKELIINKDYGCILKNNTEEELVGVIDMILNNRTLIKSASDLSYNRCIDNFTWDIVSEKVHSIIEEAKH